MTDKKIPSQNKPPQKPTTPPRPLTEGVEGAGKLKPQPTRDSKK